MKRIFLSIFILNLIFSVFAQNARSSQNSNKQPKKTQETATNPVSAQPVEKKSNSAQKLNVKKTKKAAPVVNGDFKRGEEFFQLNMPEEALLYLESVLQSKNIDPKVYIYLGIVYFQQENYEKSIDICETGLKLENTDHKVLYYNAGNSSYAMKNYSRAKKYYEQSLEASPKYSPAVLNLANAQLRLDMLEESKRNYEAFLEMEPETEKRPKIEEILALIDAELEYRAKMKPVLVVDELTASQEEPLTTVPTEIVEHEDVKAPVLPPPPRQIESGEIISAEEQTAPAVAPLPRNEDYGEQISDEKVAPVLPKVPAKSESSGEKLSGAEEKAPALPRTPAAPVSGEKLKAEENRAPSLPKSEKAKKTEEGEMVQNGEKVPPAVQPEKKSKNYGEQVSVPVLPEAKEKKKPQKLEKVSEPSDLSDGDGSAREENSKPKSSLDSILGELENIKTSVQNIADESAAALEEVQAQTEE